MVLAIVAYFLLVAISAVSKLSYNDHTIESPIVRMIVLPPLIILAGIVLMIFGALLASPVLLLLFFK